MTGRWDAVVVGGRVAGASTALLLARAGLRVLCLDRSRRGSDTVSTHALMRAGVLQLRRWGLLDEIVAAGTPAVHRVVFHYGDDEVPVSVRPSSGVEALYAPRRTLLDRVLVDAAARAGATVRHGTRVTGLLRDAVGRVTGVRTTDRDGTARTERTALVIGADGRSSLVAAEAGAALRFAGRSATGVVYGYWAGLPADGYGWYYDRGVSAGTIPTNDGLTCVFAGGRPDRVAGLVRDVGPQGALRALAGRTSLGEGLAGAEPRGAVRHVRGTPGHLRAAAGPGWALVGDAGYWKDPLSTHGMTAALRDAELLARAVVEAPRPGPAQAASLRRYARARDDLSLPMLAVVERVAAHDWDLDGIRVLLRQMASAMTDEVDLLAGLPRAA
ncbi:NAD(P)/FAD-dependent oxidoreductase [Geodermatophilus sp. YIM 151500]|uniref:NAD(P)/FAD-dependent oxidoreductase n=1 Tax=Geodermatophilus sp. YIM 151500 TaxID=2984531 RepID=UPI0021E40393|nr:NAD(P)/FAD-dependent oxidoreductase [Geodermatophilus sp. YIM 151500]MCV2491283.1 NAD(P)/FAD-dependent oxidoreductase [Geodermatophilus sp. YIM 151500]